MLSYSFFLVNERHLVAINFSVVVMNHIVVKA